MKVFYSDPFKVPLPPGHRFPIGKYRLLREWLTNSDIADQLTFELAPPVSDRDLLLVHLPAYLEKVVTGNLSVREVRRLGLPWTPELVERARRSVGGTVAACRAAMEQGVARQRPDRAKTRFRLVRSGRQTGPPQSRLVLSE